MLGVLAAYFLFFLFFYLIFPRSKLLIFFTLALAGITFRLAATSIFPVQLIFNISWVWLIRIEYLGTYMALCFGLWYFETLFPTPVTRKINIINSAMSGLIAVVILSSRVRIFSWSVYYLEPVALLMTGWYMLASFKKRKERDQWNYLYFIAFLVYLLALLNDIFLANSWEAFSMRYILHFSVLLLIIVQALMIIRNWVRIFIEKERLLGKIEYINLNLENIVKARTEEVNVRNIEIRHQNKKIARQNDELQREIEFKNRVFSIIAHDLREPLSSINLYLQMATTDLPVAKRKDVLASTVTIARSTYNLVENLLYWGRSQDKQLSLHAREFKLEDVIREIFSLLHETARQKGVDLIADVQDTIRIRGDREIILIILRNLVSNAIKFSNRGNDVSVSVASFEDNVIIIIEDHGIGMTTEQREAVFSGETIVSTFGTGNEKGTGLGLRLCLDLVRLHQGKMEIRSKAGKGTSIIITLPHEIKGNED